MNFKIYFLFILLLAGCGVKAPPLKHPDTVIESYVQGYTGQKGSVPVQQPRDQKIVPAPSN